MPVKAENRARCCIDGCAGFSRNKGDGPCEAHYYRMRRTGSYEVIVPDRPPCVRSDGYVMEHLPDHPIWEETNGRIYQHRRVFYDAYGRGPHDCHWCGSSVDWPNLHVDHLNFDKSDNSLENLMPSCAKCNIGRAEVEVDYRERKGARVIEFMGRSMVLSDWAAELGMSPQSLLYRLRSGWGIDRSLTQPRRSYDDDARHHAQNAAQTRRRGRASGDLFEDAR